MTTLACWVGVDERGPSSLYLAADSRISWPTSAGEVWDQGRKVFSSRAYPDVFGYVGDVLFPALVLSQVIALIDEGALLPQRGSSAERFAVLSGLFKRSADAVPAGRRAPFSIVYGTRDGEGMASAFRLFRLEWTANREWIEHANDAPATSDVLCVLGSGATSVSRWKERWDRTTEGGTSRAIYSAFCDAINASEDSRTGGAPQVVGLIRVGAARVFGTVLRGVPHVLGIPIVDGAGFDTSKVRWWNAAFEVCDASGKPLPKAKKHRVPRGLGNGLAR